jgi:hypothetical protein
MLIINAIIPGKNEIKVTGVRALCASLNVFDLLAIAIHKPLISKEYPIITIHENNIAGIDKLLLYKDKCY